MRVLNLFLAVVLCALAVADWARADSLYYAGTNNGNTYSFGTVDATGNKTVIGTGINFGTNTAEKLMFAPDGTLYGFDVSYAGGSGAWGRINPATGALTQIGNLNTVFGLGNDRTETFGFSLAFGASGNLYVTGYNPADSRMDYGTLSLTTGAFTKIAASPVMYSGSLASWGNSVYYAGTNNGSTYSFGTVDSAGIKTVIGTGLNFGTNTAEKLMFAPDGTLYGFDVSYAGGSGAWGRINTATGALTQIGNLNTVFGLGNDRTETFGFSLAFGASGNLYVTGYNPADSRMDYGTLSLTTGAFTKISASPVMYSGSLTSPVPEPSTFVLLGFGAVSLLAYAWRRRAT